MNRIFQHTYCQPAMIYAPLILLLFMASCRKKDELSPSISITQPLVQSVFYYGESIHVSATANDENSLEFLKIEIINENNLPVLHSVLEQGEGSSAIVLDTQIEFDDVHLESGIYYVRATASDGENIKTAFREISLQGAPLELKKVFIVRYPTLGNTIIDSLDQQNNLVTCFSIPISYDIGNGNSYHQYITLTGQDFEGIESIDPDYFTSLSTIETPYGLSADYFEDITFDPYTNRTYLSAKDGSIRSLGIGGLQTGALNVQGNFFARKILVTQDYVITYEETSGAIQKALSVYFKSSGQLVHSMALSQPIVDLVINNSQDEILVVMNNGATSDFKLYDVTTNSLTDLDFIISISSEPAITAEIKNDQAVFVAHDSHIQLYQNLQASGFGFSISDVELMRYDKVNDVLYVLTNGTIHVLNGQATSELYTVPVPPDIVDLMLLYNK